VRFAHRVVCNAHERSFEEFVAALGAFWICYPPEEYRPTPPEPPMIHVDVFIEQMVLWG
jgi:hypothetical protein